MGYEVDFLAVGNGDQSGDAIALRFGNLHGDPTEQRVVVVDGGFRESGEELVDHIKEYYGTNVVDLVVSTHPDSDHASGLEVVLTKLQVRRLWMHRPWEHTDDIARMFRDGRVTDNSVRQALRRSLDDARTLERIANQKEIPIEEPFAGLSDESSCLVVVGPTKQYYESLLPQFRGAPETAISPLRRAVTAAAEFGTRVAESLNFETLTDEGETSAENNSSVILLLQVDGKSVLLTGDAGIPALTGAADLLDSCGFDYGSIQLIQVPHHGSRRNVGTTILNRLLGSKLTESKKLRSAYASVSREGEPKHPAKKVTNTFLRRGASVYVTKGKQICYRHHAPDRGWVSAAPLPLYYEVEE